MRQVSLHTLSHWIIWVRDFWIHGHIYSGGKKQDLGFRFWSPLLNFVISFPVTFGFTASTTRRFTVYLDKTYVHKYLTTGYLKELSPCTWHYTRSWKSLLSLRENIKFHSGKLSILKMYMDYIIIICNLNFWLLKCVI